MSSQHPQQRRIFRGRGGPNDRRLPKYNARRRRTQTTSPPVSTQDFALLNSAASTDNNSTGESHIEQRLEVEGPEPEILIDHEDTVQSCQVDEVDSSKESRISDDTEDDIVSISSPLIQCQEETSNPNVQANVQHLLKRIQNNRQSFSSSKDGLFSTDSFQANVLNAVRNCVDEWKSIVRHYEKDVKEENQQPVVSLSHKIQVGQALFELLQHALQSGPLSGSKPGYFKRCGSELATMVHAFLCEIVATSDEATSMLHFTEKQAMTVETWKTNALTASESGKSPSTSILQKQDEADKQRHKKQQLKEKKKNKKRK